MAGQLAIRAPHLDGSEPIGVWADAAWAVYADFLMVADKDRLDGLTAAMEDLDAPLVDEDGVPIDGPTAETWGASEEAQNSMLGLMASLSASGVGAAGDGS